ncbi:OmpP1/FadL family transporter [Ulvibacter litoralis]|uniref:Long-chain fatty acid transport protein n=1 Tax=Ulvibacter litoralis TaxID=227084 RepID=A0A1G7CMR0_9FLAO|nr:outer membrane protein transport protein [Ulvibacter litoralis]GHC46798.1 membrane protein [Ulvibacter litoralis]SDE40612.1 Long-chain fatty acid transport protein [Ulvibacter litoralis]
MTIKVTSLSLLFFISVSAFSQTNDLSSSPYSLYGLGLRNNLNTGEANTLGKTGIASHSTSSINGLNPASFASFHSNSFLYDIGVKVQQETLVEGGVDESRTNANFSSLAFAFPVSSKFGVGLTLLPFTNVGYFVSGVPNEIEGSNEQFNSDIYGSGGLNDIKINAGYKVTDKLSVGVSGSYLFGKIEENETNYFQDNVLYVNEENFYSGFQLKTGLQYTFNSNFSFGAVASLPTSLKGDQENTVTLSVADAVGTVEESQKDLDAFKLPLEIGLGVETKLKENLSFNIDYTRRFWSATNQTDQSGTFVNQDIIGLGTKYIPNKNSTNYWDRMNYRAGLNFDSGSIEINNTRVSNYEATIGLGIPFSKKNNSMLNVGYSYGVQGRVANNLIQENYHLLTLNLSLENIWFVKRYID